MLNDEIIEKKNITGPETEKWPGKGVIHFGTQDSLTVKLGLV